jgi:toxin ParE1/3/4
MRQVRLSALAALDLAGIWDYVATQSENPETAKRILARIGESLILFRHTPLAGRQRSEMGPNIRSFVTGNYVVYYRSTDEEVLILRIVHGSRDQETIDFGESGGPYSNR